MKKNLIFALAVISILIIFPSTLALSHAATYNRIGVRASDWMDYSVSYYSTYPGDPDHEYIPTTFNYYNKVHIDILDVIATNVTLRITYFYPDGTTSSKTWSGDISKNLCDYLIIAGLNAGDLVCTGTKAIPFGNLTVSQTVNMTVLGTQRYVNVVIPRSALDAQVGLLFEKSTGILVESERSSLLFGWKVERITDTSVLPHSLADVANPTLVLLAGVVIAMAMAMMALFTIADRKRQF